MKCDNEDSNNWLEQVISVILGTAVVFLIGLMIFSSINKKEKPCEEYKEWRVSRIPVRCLEYFKLLDTTVYTKH